MFYTNFQFLIFHLLNFLQPFPSSAATFCYSCVLLLPNEKILTPTKNTKGTFCSFSLSLSFVVIVVIVVVVVGAVVEEEKIILKFDWEWKKYNHQKFIINSRNVTSGANIDN
jgi:hypothetical protein